MLQIKNSQYYSDLAEILAVLPSHVLITLTKFDEDWTKIVDFLLALYFWSSIIFFNKSLLPGGGKIDCIQCTICQNRFKQKVKPQLQKFPTIIGLVHKFHLQA